MGQGSLGVPGLGSGGAVVFWVGEGKAGLGLKGKLVGVNLGGAGAGVR